MWSQMLATLVLIVGMVFTPLRAAAAIPVLIAHVAANVRTTRLAALTLGRCELRTASKYAYDEIPAAYDHQSNPRVMPGVAAIQRRTAPSKAPTGARCRSDDALYDAPSATNAAEGLEAAAATEFQVADRVVGQLADSRLGSLAGKISPERLQQLANNPNALRFLDTASGNTNVVQLVEGRLLRITTAGNEAGKIISVGPIQQNGLFNGIANGRFNPLIP